MSKINGAGVLISALKTAGIEKIFSLSGNQIMPLYDACIDAEIEIIHVRHEAAAVHMADAWARLSNRLGVAMLTAGPGHANALSALYTAKASESPLVLLSGHAPLGQQGCGAFQEMPQAELAGGLCKAAWCVNRAEQLGEAFAQAACIAQSGRAGPVHLSLPYDLLIAPVDDHALVTTDVFQVSSQRLNTSHIAAINAYLENAERALIITGPSAMREPVQNDLHTLMEKRALAVIGMESPRGVNDPSLGRLKTLLKQADVVLLLGKALDYTLQFGRALADDCVVLQIDPESTEFVRTRRNLTGQQRLALSAQADVLPATQGLLEHSSNTVSDQSWLQSVDKAISARPEVIVEHKQNGLHAVQVCQTVQAYLAQAKQDTVLVADGGEFGQWSQAFLQAPKRLINGTAGAIGCALPYAIGARLACPDALVVALLGDGTFGFHMSEFDSAVRYKLPFVAILGNDACWNAEYQIQLRDYGSERTIGCELLATRYDQVVSALGGHGEYVSQLSELEPALQRAFASGLPACINIVLQRHAAPTMNK